MWGTAECVGRCKSYAALFACSIKIHEFLEYLIRFSHTYTNIFTLTVTYTNILTHSKICDLHVTLAVQQNILRFEVSVVDMGSVSL